MTLSRNTAVLVTGIAILFGSAGFVRAEVTLKGSLVCNGACVTNPKLEDHVMALFAIDGTAEIRAEVDRLVNDYFPEKGLNAEAALKLLEQFDMRLKYYIARNSPALKDEKNRGNNHYCHAARAVAVTGAVVEKDGKNWITADMIDPAVLKYPERMLAADTAFVRRDEEPLILRINDKLTLKCISIPPGKFLMGTLYCIWPYYQEECPHPVKLTKPYYLAEIPVTPPSEKVGIQRSGRGLVKDGWSVGLREFITEKPDYTGQKFRILVEADASPGR